MPEIQTAAQCDNCYETTKDYIRAGWATVQGQFVKYRLNRDGKGHGETELFWQSPGDWINSKKYFCSMDCFLNKRRK
jgi:hypothetical protein